MSDVDFAAVSRRASLRRWADPAYRTKNTGWTAEQDAELARLWASVLSTSAIGHEMGLSKNAVVGRAHRMGLPARPSPIRAADPNRALPRPERAPKRTLPKLPSISPPAPFVAAIAAIPVASSTAIVEVPCQYIVSADRPWKFCGAPACRNVWPGVYCPDHQAACCRLVCPAEQVPGAAP